MELKGIKRIISLVIYGLVSVIIALIIIRLFLLFIGANQSTPAVVFLINSSETFVAPFRGIYFNIVINNGTFIIEIFSVIALLFYVSIAFLVSKSIRSVVESDVIQLITNLIDTGFKFLEFILIARFIFKLTGASTSSQFIQVLYAISNVIYEPFKGILPGFSIPSINAVFETSTIIAIVVIIIFDVITEGIIEHLRADLEANPSKPKQPKPSISHVIEKHTVVAPQPQAPNITINIPHQGPTNPEQPTQYVDRRTINVISPGSPTTSEDPLRSANYLPFPYYGQNDLERQRPAAKQQSQGQTYSSPWVQNRPQAPRSENPT